MSFDTLPDGRIVFPQQGKPPKAPYGYDPDPGDPWVFIPAYDKCDHRMTQTFVKPCGKLAGRPWCKLHDCEATPATCEDCKDLIYVDGSILDSVGPVQPTIIEEQQQPPTIVTEPQPPTIVTEPQPPTGEQA
jgi:hypothetical protein